MQARLSASEVEQLDRDRVELGLASRSAALREGIGLVHRRARQAALARDYDEFYGTGQEAPVSDVAALGDRIAADAIAARESAQESARESAG